MAATPDDAGFDSVTDTANSTTLVTNSRTFVANALYILVVSGRASGIADPTGVETTSGTTAWTLVVGQTNSTTNVSIWKFIPSSNETDTVTITWAATILRKAAHILEYDAGSFNATQDGASAGSNDIDATHSITFNADGLSGSVGGTAVSNNAVAFATGTDFTNDPPNDLDTTETLSQGAAFSSNDDEQQPLTWTGSSADASVFVEIRGPAAAVAAGAGMYYHHYYRSIITGVGH